ncbi:MAG: hypothetical protein V4484_01205 [Pseudomonadota bacterium]
MRLPLLVLCVLLGMAGVPASAQLSIGLTLSSYPRLVRVPGYPVYYAPSLRSNYFFYDGLYWVYLDDNWYVSRWYNGPWELVEPDVVPLYVLRVPVRYYRAPPPYFLDWRRDAPPRWHEHWGPRWSERHHDWNRWNRRAAPAPAPLPHYQRQYSARNYPPDAQSQQLAGRHYRYQSRDPVVRQQLPAPPQPVPRHQERPVGLAPPPLPRAAPAPRPTPQPREAAGRAPEQHGQAHAPHGQGHGHGHEGEHGPKSHKD